VEETTKRSGKKSNTMIPAKRRDRREYSTPLGCRGMRGIGFILTAVMAMGPRTGGAEQPQVRASDGPKVTTSDDVTGRNNRPARRIARASSEDVASTERRRKRSPRNAVGRRARQVEKGDDGHIHLHLSGSFELNLGKERFMHGEGSTTIELDRDAVEKLRIGMAQSLHGAGKDVLKAVEALPGTLQSTSEILSSLSDPETQKALRQIEQLLRLLSISSPQPDSGK
jgi:hypothetical protein